MVLVIFVGCCFGFVVVILFASGFGGCFGLLVIVWLDCVGFGVCLLCWLIGLFWSLLL